MPLSETEKAQVRQYLGSPDLFKYENTRLESALQVIDGNDEAVALIQADLAALAKVETALINAMDIAGLTKAETISWSESATTLSILRSQGRMYCGRIAQRLGVQKLNDAFGDDYQGDAWMSRHLPRLW